MSRLVMLALVIVSAHSNGYCYVPRVFTLPEMVVEAEVIAQGIVDLSKSTPILHVDALLKGECGGSVELTYRQPVSAVIGPQFSDGEHVLVFLESVDAEGRGILLGVGSEGKWPKSPGTGPHGQTYRVSDLGRIRRAVETVQRVFAKTDIVHHDRAITEMLASDDEILKLAGLQIVSSGLLTRYQATSYIDGRPLHDHVSAIALGLLEADNQDIRSRAIRLLANAPSVVGARALIPLLGRYDPCYNTLLTSVAVILGEAKADCPVQLASMRSRWGHRGCTPEELESVRDACQDSWDAVADRRMEYDRKMLLRWHASSSSEPQKKAADMYLEWLGITPTSP